MCTSLQLGGLRGQQERLVNSPSIHDFTCLFICSEHFLAAAQQTAAWAGREEREKESNTLQLPDAAVCLGQWMGAEEIETGGGRGQRMPPVLVGSVQQRARALLQEHRSVGWASLSVLVTACPAGTASTACRPCLVCTFLRSSISIPSARAWANSSATHLQEASSLRFFPSGGIWEAFSSPVKEQNREKKHRDVVPH